MRDDVIDVFEFNGYKERHAVVGLGLE